MATSIFTSQVPVVQDANDGTDYTLGTAFRRSNAGTIIQGRWWCPLTPPTGTPDFVLYDTADGSLVHREPWPGLVGGEWNVSPAFEIEYPANELWVAGVYTSGQYVATVNPAFWNGTDLVNDDITAPGDATNGRLSNVDSYPSNVVDLCFFVDIVFAGGVAPAEGTLNTIIDLAPALTGARASEGALAGTLGLAAALTGARASEGVLAAGLGLSPSLTGARPSLGSLAAGLNFTVSLTGTNGETGRPVAPFPFPPGPASGFPWPPRPVKSFQEVSHP